jgi:two-component system, chemotaxis family, response regulator Rcp1
MLQMERTRVTVDFSRNARMTETRETASVEILLVEDSPFDAELMVEALKAGSLSSRVTVAEDGEEAIAYLRTEKTGASFAPDLILLDLHMPKMNGHEFLEEMKQDAGLRRIPVVIMTSSENDADFLKAYDLHANCCVFKPVNQEQFALVVRKIELFWLRVAHRA